MTYMYYMYVLLHMPSSCSLNPNGTCPLITLLLNLNNQKNERQERERRWADTDLGT